MVSWAPCIGRLSTTSPTTTQVRDGCALSVTLHFHYIAADPANEALKFSFTMAHAESLASLRSSASSTPVLLVLFTRHSASLYTKQN